MGKIYSSKLHWIIIKINNEKGPLSAAIFFEKFNHYFPNDVEAWIEIIDIINKDLKKLLDLNKKYNRKFFEDLPNILIKNGLMSVLEHQNYQILINDLLPKLKPCEIIMNYDNEVFKGPFEKCNIFEIISNDQLVKMIEDLNNDVLIGLDTESESYYGNSKLTIVQISTKQKAFIIHWQKLNHYDRKTIERFYETLLKKKIFGFELKTDLMILNQFGYGKLDDSISNMQMARNHKNFESGFFEVKEDEISLSKLCENMIGKKLSKRHTCSLWNKYPLSDEQKTYAYLDAYVPLILGTDYIDENYYPDIHFSSIENILTDFETTDNENTHYDEKESNSNYEHRESNSNYEHRVIFAKIEAYLIDFLDEDDFISWLQSTFKSEIKKMKMTNNLCFKLFKISFNSKIDENIFKNTSLYPAENRQKQLVRCFIDHIPVDFQIYNSNRSKRKGRKGNGAKRRRMEAFIARKKAEGTDSQL